MANGFTLENLFKKFEGESLSYSDLILMPQYLDFPTNEVTLSGWLTKNIKLQVPFVSSPMDTVTESKMAVAMALMGGIGIIHCNNTIEDQASQVAEVKRYRNGFIDHPITVRPTQSISAVLELSFNQHFSGFPVVEEIDGKLKLVGMISRRDVDLIETPTLVRDAMRPLSELVVGQEGMTLEEVHHIIKTKGISRLPIINPDGELVSLVCRKDVRESRIHPNATRDPKTQKLLVGASVTTHPRDRDRVDCLVEAGVDVIVIDSAQGCSSYQLETLRYIKKTYPHIDVIAGNVVTQNQASVLLDAGADGLRVGMGAGCFGANTPVLMANRTYKRIIDIQSGDRVINMYGVPVTVKAMTHQGKKRVLKVKSSMFNDYFYVTPDHRFWAVSTSTMDTYDSLANQVNSADEINDDRIETTIPGQWMSIGIITKDNLSTVMPSVNSISFEEDESTSQNVIDIGRANQTIPNINLGVVDSFMEYPDLVETYDIEVDCPTHSFIAANCIVHNSICTTQSVCGVGRGQATAVHYVSKCAQPRGIPVIADGGISASGDIIKALVLGANCVMMGSMFAACDESPGEIVYQNSAKLKTYRGMGAKANKNSQAVRSRYGVTENIFVPQGVEGKVVSAGSVHEVVPHLAQAVRQGFQDIGAKSAEDARRSQSITMERRSVGAQAEGNVHHLHSYQK